MTFLNILEILFEFLGLHIYLSGQFIITQIFDNLKQTFWSCGLRVYEFLLYMLPLIITGCHTDDQQVRIQ